MSFHEIFKSEPTQYLISNGELSFRKAKLIRAYFEKKEYRRLILGNDNDLAGQYFNLCIIGGFLDYISSIRKSNKNIAIEMKENEIDKNIAVLKQFFKKEEQKLELNDKSEFPQSYFTETLSQNMKQHYFMIENTSKSIGFFVGLLMSIWKLDQFIQIKIPKGKDFNEDLIKKKANG